MPPSPLAVFPAVPSRWANFVATTSAIWFHEKGGVRAMDLATGKLLTTLEDAPFAMSKGFIAVGFTLYDLTGKKLRAFTGLKDKFLARLYAIDGAATIAVGTQVNDLLVFDGSSGKLAHRIEIPGLQKATVDPTGTTIAVARGGGKPVLLIDEKTLKQRVVKGASFPKNDPVTFAWYVFGNFMVAWCGSSALYIDVRKGTVKSKTKLHNAEGFALLQGSPIALWGHSKLDVIDVPTGTTVATHKVAAQLISDTPEGDRIVVGTESGGIAVYKTSDIVWPPERKAAAKGAARASTKAATKTKATKVTPANGVFFGVSAETDLARVIDAGMELHHILDRQPPDFAMYVATTETHHWFTFAGTKGRSYLLAPWIETLQISVEAPLDVVVRQGKDLHAERFTTPFESTSISVDDSHLLAKAAAKPIALVAGRKKIGRPVPRAKVASLVGVVETTAARTRSIRV